MSKQHEDSILALPSPKYLKRDVTRTIDMRRNRETYFTPKMLILKIATTIACVLIDEGSY